MEHPEEVYLESLLQQSYHYVFNGVTNILFFAQILAQILAQIFAFLLPSSKYPRNDSDSQKKIQHRTETSCFHPFKTTVL